MRAGHYTDILKLLTDHRKQWNRYEILTCAYGPWHILALVLAFDSYDAYCQELADWEANIATPYYAVFTLDKQQKEGRSAQHKIISFDPNHKNLVYGVGTDGEAVEIHNMAHLKKLDATIDRLKSRRDRCKRKSVKITRPDGTFFWKASRRWTFFDARLKDTYRIRREQTKTFLYTLANQIYKRYDTVFVGNYTPHGGGISTKMRRSMNNQSLIARFKLTMSWVAKRFGRSYFEYDETGTTRTCCDCSHGMPDGIPPDVREWNCPQCGVTHIRDENAAINGLKKNILSCSDRRCTPLVRVRRVWWVLPGGVASASRGLDGSPLMNTTKKLKRQGATLCTPQTKV